MEGPSFGCSEPCNSRKCKTCQYVIFCQNFTELDDLNLRLRLEREQFWIDNLLLICTFPTHGLNLDFQKPKINRNSDSIPTCYLFLKSVIWHILLILYIFICLCIHYFPHSCRSMTSFLAD